MKVGMFDSGIGGLSILSSLLTIRPDAQVYYFADDAFAPYGSKSDEVLLERSIVIVDKFIELGIDLIVLACNTATAVCIDDLRTRYPEIQFVGIEPYVNIVNQIPWDDKKKAVILTTPLTGKSSRFNKLKEKLDPNNYLSHYSCPGLAQIVETAYWEKKEQERLESEIRNELSSLLTKGYEYYILGCTHYPLVSKYIQRISGAKVLSPCRAVANRISDLMGQASTSVDGTMIDFYFYSSARHQDFIKQEFPITRPWPEL
ncbi:aspartate/glutamate racemase family protein [Halobacteriovorax sp. GB3]|uniref:glutamate racemase n=1 Tax=Halobacteriovorax sp. GB3 TaxID=2719615 RepID=UPI0023629789|nr:aspartate/glutamate racemase family protein [Halobacteriovorax sp. GB3]MDD0852827.1 aspartate/glutamate racemase family protein [Halobacteriovorax sp. GB3]